MSQEFIWLTMLSATLLEKVRDYIGRQEEHHRQMTFQDEVRGMLRKCQMEWDERYVWD